jgi:hypothetical protein
MGEVSQKFRTLPLNSENFLPNGYTVCLAFSDTEIWACDYEEVKRK